MLNSRRAEQPTEGDLTIIAVKDTAIREDVTDHINDDNVCVAQLIAENQRSRQQYENDCIICSSPSWWYFDETLEDAAERLRMKRKVNKNLA
ncbi:hypothetical protein EVAR_70625_1 [Eumeta japonica]|uniref:Uncharacterized protein n=1 Tax=Eumeta variegata TaxID=151549 RepID=A0A4C2AD60_EUMVA|nr:hypothetical protein EVAR_70625_1 [Eumeta japonica]